MLRHLLVAFAVACSGPPPERPPPAPQEPPAQAAPPEATSPPEVEPSPTSQAQTGPDPDSRCGRAYACCRAFAAVTPHVDVESACAEPAEVARQPDADARCERMQLGWRVALEHHRGAEIPDACEPPQSD